MQLTFQNKNNGIMQFGLQTCYGVDTNGRNKSKNKHSPYPWLICPQYP